MKKISAAARKARNLYQNNWRKNNPEKVKQYVDDYWERKAASYTPEQQARDLRATGMTQRDIAARLHLSLGAVNKYVNRCKGANRCNLHLRGSDLPGMIYGVRSLFTRIKRMAEIPHLFPNMQNTAIYIDAIPF